VLLENFSFVIEYAVTFLSFSHDSGTEPPEPNIRFRVDLTPEQQKVHARFDHRRCRRLIPKEALQPRLRLLVRT
jgi:hypothetical protein